jgi:NADH:ubiquinone oxidoreductase subunit 6 (subunit J)
MIIVWKRQGHIALTLPFAAIAFNGLVLRHQFPLVSKYQVLLLLAAVAVFYLGRKWNRADDIGDIGKHLFFGIPVEYWGIALAVAVVIELISKPVK